MLLSRGAGVIPARSLGPFERGMTLLILLATATPTGGIPAEFACPWGRGGRVPTDDVACRGVRRGGAAGGSTAHCIWATNRRRAASASAPFVVGGVVKIAYDLTLWGLFRRVKPPEETIEPSSRLASRCGYRAPWRGL
jgi:hypothetical protein